MPVKRYKTYSDNWKKAINRKIQFGRSQLKKSHGVDDDQYYDMLMTRYGVESSKDMGPKQLIDLVEHMERMGVSFTPKSPKPKNVMMKASDDPQILKIKALWRELHDVGAVRDPGTKAMTSYIKRQTGVDRPEWLNTHQASNVIESLKKWFNRVAS